MNAIHLLLENSILLWILTFLEPTILPKISHSGENSAIQERNFGLTLTHPFYLKPSLIPPFHLKLSLIHLIPFETEPNSSIPFETQPNPEPALRNNQGTITPGYTQPAIDKELRVYSMMKPGGEDHTLSKKSRQSR